MPRTLLRIPQLASGQRSIIRDAIGVGLGTATYGLAFGAGAVAKGFSVWQTSVLSLFMFTGGSQFAFISVLGVGGSVLSALGVTWLLGARNGMYAMQLVKVLPRPVSKRLVASQLVIDESLAMSVTRESHADARLGFFATGLSVFVFWNLATLIGALAVGLVDDPNTFGLDAAFPAGFLVLIWPQLKGRPAIATAVVAALLALFLIPLTPAGVPILASSLAAFVGATLQRRDRSADSPTSNTEAL